MKGLIRLNSFEAGKDIFLVMGSLMEKLGGLTTHSEVPSRLSTRSG